MWHRAYPFQQHPLWGLHARAVSDEAKDLLAGVSLAACISTLEIIRVSGEDALTFLQGQTTCDFREVAAGLPRLGAHCNVKGRVQASFRALHWNGDFLLLVPHGQGEPTRAALARFALFSKVTLSLETGLLPLALLGEQAAAWAQAALGAAPAPGESHAGEAGLVTTLEPGRVLALVPAAAAATMVEALQRCQALLAGDNVWWLAEIRAGIAHITPELSEQWLPQEINYDLVNGVNFRKGCYKGQEIVARIHYRGQTKTRTVAVQIDLTADTGAETVIPGTHIVGAAHQNVATLLNRACVNERTLMGLAAMKTGASESEQLRLEPNDGCAVHPLPLPYAIPN